MDTSVKPQSTREVSIGKMRPDDWNEIRAIYLEGIASGHATFETTAPDWEQWDSSHLPFARLVARDAGSVRGWAALSSVSRRQAYAGVAEVSVYVSTNSRGQGLGGKLLESLIAESEAHWVWTLQAVMFLENQASVALHMRCGFREVGRREAIGKLNGVWRDTILLERRSTKIGIG